MASTGDLSCPEVSSIFCWQPSAETGQRSSIRHRGHSLFYFQKEVNLIEAIMGTVVGLAVSFLLASPSNEMARNTKSSSICRRKVKWVNICIFIYICVYFMYVYTYTLKWSLTVMNFSGYLRKDTIGEGKPYWVHTIFMHKELFWQKCFNKKILLGSYD